LRDYLDWEEVEYGGSPRKEILGIETFVDEESDGSFTVSDLTLNMYGVGATEEEAVADYKSVIREYFEILNESKDRLSRQLQEHYWLLLELQAKENTGWN